MSKFIQNSDLVELGVVEQFADEEAEVPEKAPADEAVEAPVDEEVIKTRFEELTGKKPRANAKIETLIATIEELE